MIAAGNIIFSAFVEDSKSPDETLALFLLRAILQELNTKNEINSKMSFFIQTRIMYGLFKINVKQLQQRKNKRIAVVISSPNELKRFSAASFVSESTLV